MTGSFQHATTGEEVAGTLTWVNPAFIPTADDTYQDWIFTPIDHHNYEEVRGSVQVKWAPRPVNSENPVLSANADLAVLQVWADGQELNLSPSFFLETTHYTARTEAEWIKVAAMTAHYAATVKLDDDVLTDTLEIELAEGVNTVILTVQAENGTQKKYTLTLTRDLPKLLPTANVPPFPPTNPAITFTDIAGHWAESDIKRAATAGWISGYPGGTFQPNEPVTRAEFNVMLSGALQWEGAGADLPFADDDRIGAWARDAVTHAVHAGIVHGYEDGLFRPNAPITRSEMAAMIDRALKMQTNAGATGFADDDAIPQWSKGAIEAIRQLGIIGGRGDNRFVANETATRAEATVMLLRMLEHS